MKSLLLIVLMVLFIVGCENNTVDPIDENPNNTEEAVGQLRLVPLTANDLAKALTDENGRQWLPASEMLYVLFKTASFDIDFGEVKATRALQYVIMNVGNRDVFNINFNSRDLKIHPISIGLIPASEVGGDLAALPIVNITKEHVIPIDGVGSLLDMSVGNFSDTLSMTYQYELSGDTIDVIDDYDVGGTKMGTTIDILFSGEKIENYNVDTYYNLNHDGRGIESWPTIYRWGYTESDIDTSRIVNTGNVEMRIRLFKARTSIVFLDTVLQPNQNIDTSGLLRDIYESESTADIILVGDILNQPYIFKVAGDMVLGGYAALIIGETGE